jgi:hypothetical protein
MLKELLIYIGAAIVFIPIAIFVLETILVLFCAITVLMLENDQGYKITKFMEHVRNFNDKLNFIGSKLTRFYIETTDILMNKDRITYILKILFIRIIIWLILFLLTFFVVIPNFLTETPLIGNILLSIISSFIGLFVIIDALGLYFD